MSNMETSELVEKAKNLYVKLGGISSQDARLVRGMIERLEYLQAKVEQLKDARPPSQESRAPAAEPKE